jgi:probable F420-dependent oxidoreductase
MKIDAVITNNLTTAPDDAHTAEQAGYDGVWSAEAGHDPFLPLLMGAEHTQRIELGTAIVVAFGRTPMVLAGTAWDLNSYSGGRFILGIGSQIKPHIERRYSMPWSNPAPRMREFILGLRAIWDCWQSGTKLDFRGQFYTHTLMTPFFNPGPNDEGPPRVFLAAVGEGMTRVAGEVADGMLVHGFTTERYLREITQPAVESALKASGRAEAEFELSYSAFVVSGTTDEQMESADVATRKQIAFYGSTPAYRPVLELHGWGDLQTDLNALSKRGEWDQMGLLITDEILDSFAVRADPNDVPYELDKRFGDLIDRVSLYMPDSDSEAITQILSGLKDLRDS